jgi:uncharacterized protein
MSTKSKAITVYLLIAFIGTWAVAFGFWAMGGKWNTAASTMIITGCMFFPLLAAVIAQTLVSKEKINEGTALSFKLNRWFFIAWLLPPALQLLTMLVALSFPGVNYAPGMEGMFERLSLTATQTQIHDMRNFLRENGIARVMSVGILQGLLVGATANAVAGFGEEFGWRAFLYRQLIPLGFWKSSLVIGLIWGVWHAPFVAQGLNYPHHPVAGIFMMIIWCLLLSPIFSLIRLKSKSVIAASIFHGTINATSGLAVMAISGGSDLTVDITGLAGCIILAIVNLGIFSYGRRNPDGLKL